jgi:hypothetical protein
MEEDDDINIKLVIYTGHLTRLTIWILYGNVQGIVCSGEETPFVYGYLEH